MQQFRFSEYPRLSVDCRPAYRHRAPGRKTTLAAFALVSTLGVTQAFASAGGRTGFSGDPSLNSGATCDVCHAPDADGTTPPVVGIWGPDTMDAGSTHTLAVIVVGGPGQSAGVGISSQNGVGALSPEGGDLQLLQGELTHTAPKGLSNSVAAFNFQYTAPNYDADVTLHAAGNSTNGALDLLGDAVATATLDIDVINGFEPPPDPQDPPSGELPVTLFASGLTQPVVITNARDNRLFIAERAGRIQIVRRDGSVRGTPFLDISSRVDDGASEMGLLGLAFHPGYKNNGYFYVYYTYDPGPGRDRSRISRFSVSADANLADPNSERVLLEFEQTFSNHNGGDLHFGPQGYLYIASGDGGSGGDPLNAGQTTSTLLGKILRIDVDTPAGPGNAPDCDISNGNSAGANYSIPPGNAYQDGAGGAGCDEIFALGARNPWRFTFDAETGAMWIADVGQNSVEEVHYLPAGDSGGINLGWRCYEGNNPFNLSNCNKVYLPPVYTYSHQTSGCSITGGRVYRGLFSPELKGQYIFSDFCQSSVRALSGSPSNLTHRILVPTGQLAGISTFGEDFIRELYAAELQSGKIYRLGEQPPPGC